MNNFSRYGSYTFALLACIAYILDSFIGVVFTSSFMLVNKLNEIQDDLKK